MKNFLATAAFLMAGMSNVQGQDDLSQIDALEYFRENYPDLQYEKFVGPFRLSDNPDDKRILYFNEEGAENGRQAKRRVMILGVDGANGVGVEDGEFTANEITMITVKQDRPEEDKITDEIQMDVYPDGSVAETKRVTTDNGEELLAIKKPEYKTLPRKAGLDGMMEMLRLDAPKIINPPKRPAKAAPPYRRTMDQRVA